jgi:hypothetical protein
MARKDLHIIIAFIRQRAEKHRDTARRIGKAAKVGATDASEGRRMNIHGGRGRRRGAQHDQRGCTTSAKFKDGGH